MFDDLRRNDRNDSELSRFWNELVRPSSDSDIDRIEVAADAAETIRDLHALSRSVPPKTAQERVQRMIATSFGPDFDQTKGIERGARGSEWFGQNGRANDLHGDLSRRVPTAKPISRRSIYAQLAVAAILLAIAGVAIGLFWTRADSPQKSIPAAIPASPTAEPAPVTMETLLQFTLPLDELPKGEGISSGLAHFTIPPGTRSTWESYCCDGPMIEFVMEGLYTVRAESSITVVRAGGSIEEISSGTEVTLGPGDSLISRNEVKVEAANNGTEPVELLNWVLIENGNFGGHSLPGWVSHAADVQGPITEFAGPLTVTLQQYTLLPRATLTFADDTLYFAVPAPENEDGTPSAGTFARMANGSSQNVGTRTLRVYVLTWEQAVPADGSPIAASPTP